MARIMTDEEKKAIAREARSAVIRVLRSHGIEPLDDTLFLLHAIIKTGWGKPGDKPHEVPTERECYACVHGNCYEHPTKQ